MDVHGTVEELTQVCIELRRNFQATPDRKDRESMVLKHIEIFANRKCRINDFQTGLEWFNVSEELSIKTHLAGKITILDFFTYCCINCMHVLPDLAALEQKFQIKDGLLVIGVHSAKFSNERDSKKLLSAIQRYRITHPVVNDETLFTWRSLGISCWPTLVMIGPFGEPLATFVGEGHREELFLYAETALNYFKSLGQISENDIPLQPASHLLPTFQRANLLFPSKVEVFQNEEGEKLIISDTGNNRILLTDTTGKVEHTIGGNNPGYKDGEFEDARFNAPQGTCTLGDYIYIADNENHCIRRIDLRKKVVATVAGTGSQGHDYVGGKMGNDQPLSSPWDVAIYIYEFGKMSVPILLIAMAGTHQIWSLFLEDTVWWKNREYKAGTCIAIVGSGREENRNNTYPHAAGLAQPSGIAVLQESKILLFADSESSSIRQVDLVDGRVSALCGANRNPTDLHDFGDMDGTRYAAKLQHPLGVAWHPQERVAYIADTYNHKVKTVDQNTGQCNSTYGDGKPSEKFLFDEPSGIAVGANGTVLYVADTNNHAIKAIDLKCRNIATLPIEITDVERDKNDDIVEGSRNTYDFETTVDENGGNLNMKFSVSFLEKDMKLNSEAPQSWSIVLPSDGWFAKAKRGELSSSISLRVPKGGQMTELRINLDIVACKIGECIPKRLCVLYRVYREPNGPILINEEKRLLVK